MLRLVSRVQAVAISSIALNAATIVSVSGFTVAGTDVVASNRQSLASFIPRRAVTANTPRSANALMSRTKTTINDYDSSNVANNRLPCGMHFNRAIITFGCTLPTACLRPTNVMR
mmetsp:Transcript_4996/g.9751  ORF Transcript_4996/g.9751 Transcript_4996/m.9751 type:complete len:115 (-) Transcript_4996:1386-1730(-)